MTLDFENKVLHGDCHEVLKQIPDASFDAIVTDPPYGLGDEPTPEEIIAYLQGADLKTGDFMGKDWDIPSVAVWKELFRVLKPGGHALSFGGTRTWDLIAMGARMAGFERRDTISENHPGLQWVQSQGMPKSHNIGKTLAKSGKTEEATKAEGLGTALKPTWEPIIVLRKPIEGTLAANFMMYGTGGLNIDGCRVKHASKADFEHHKMMVDRLKANGGSLGDSWKNSSDLSGANDVKDAGRWPPNTLFIHSSGCKQVGEKKVKAAPAWNDNRPPSAFTGSETSPVHHSDEDGTETVEAWECESGCPVKALDDQSGVTTSGAMKHEVGGYEGESTTNFIRGRSGPSNQHGDSGGASRFFPQFEGQAPVDAPFFYSPKAAKKETTLNGQIENKHPTKKPIKLMSWLIRLVTPKGGIVLDPYCGSGSTLHAAIEEGARFTGIELDESSYHTSSKRVEIVMTEANEPSGFDQLMSQDFL